MQYEYKVVAAPQRAEKVRGARTTQDRFAHTMTALMNELGQAGWDYIRADTLPCEERTGLTRRTTTFVNMLVFRREIGRAEQPVAVGDASGSVTALPGTGAAPALAALPEGPVAPAAPRRSPFTAVAEPSGGFLRSAFPFGSGNSGKPVRIALVPAPPGPAIGSAFGPTGKDDSAIAP